MKKMFQTIQKTKVPRASFNLSHEVKLTTDIGKLTPILCEEVVPGDQWNLKTEVFARLMPLIGPLMHRTNIFIHYFYVPNRIIWSGWEDFITGNTSTTVPTKDMAASNASYYGDGKLGDYLGLPRYVTGSDIKYNSQLPFRAYWKIWNDYYRDQNLQTEVNLDALAFTHYTDLAYRAWEKDYFTSCLPTAQQGSAVTLPVGDVTYKTVSQIRDAASSNDYDIKVTDQDTSGSNNIIASGIGMTGTHNAQIKNIESVDLDINELRKAHRVQRWLEKNMRAGSRYVEHLLVHFGVRSSDKRLDRPEYLGGAKNPIVISEVLNTSDTTNAVQGEMSGHGIGVGSSTGIKYYVEEHGWIMGILSILPVTSYFQGIHKKWKRSIATDFYFPEFARLGEQEVLNEELYMKGVNADDEQTFGYQSRYAEYKYIPSRVHGEFRDTLKIWSLVREFAVPPSLNENFVTTELESLALQARVFAAGGDRDAFAIQLYHDIVAKRPMPYFADPTL